MATLGTSSLRARLALKYAARIQDAFVCRRCLHQQQQQTKPWQAYKSLRQTPFLQAFRSPTPHLSRSQSSSPLGALSQSILTKPPPPSAAAATTTRASSFPATSHKSVAYWLLASAASVFGIVVFGGLTRLTESGLSITEWRPVTGSFPPRDEAAWEAEFARYKLSPEFIMLNSRMNLEDFKSIYWMEWTHRLWGRVVGFTMLLPTAYFVVRRRVSANMAVRLVGICGLIGFQGVIGWWMVQSGLKDDLLETGQQPRVSQYRLAAHLGTAFIAYLAMLHNGLQILREHALLANLREGAKTLQTLLRPELAPFRHLVTALTALVFITAMSGALVAGLDAGLVYNDFPWMGRPNLFPPKTELLDPFYSHTPAQTDIVWRNMFENPVTAQLDHRVLATTTFTAIMALWAYMKMSPRVRNLLPVPARKGMHGVVGLVSLQVVLGITTLWYLVPTPLAAAHQAGALALLTGVFVLGSRVWVPKRLVRLVEQAVVQAQVQGKSKVGRRGPEAMLKARVGGI